MGSRTVNSGVWPRIVLSLCAALAAAGVVGLFLADRPSYARSFAPDWLALVAAGVAASGVVLTLRGLERWPRLGRALDWFGLLLLLWTASGLPIDLLRVVSLATPGLMPPGVDWAGLVTRALAFAALIALARLALTRPSGSAPAAAWYGYAALVIALPYPFLKTWWALGGSFGLRGPGAEGLAGSFSLWLPAVPWLLAAILSLLLALAPHWLPRRLLLIAGWSATIVVAMIGPIACWSLVSGLIDGDSDFGGMAGWVYGLVYGSWLLWAIAAGAATRAYQLRSAGAVERTWRVARPA